MNRTAKLVPHRVRLEGAGFTGLRAPRGEAVCRLKPSKGQPTLKGFTWCKNQQSFLLKKNCHDTQQVFGGTRQESQEKKNILENGMI